MINIVFNRTEGFHIGFENRRQTSHIGKTVRDIMILPKEDREWTFGIDSMEEAVDVCEGLMCYTPNEETLEEARRQGYKFQQSSDGCSGFWVDYQAISISRDINEVVDWLARNVRNGVFEPSEAFDHVSPFICYSIFQALEPEDRLLQEYLLVYENAPVEVLSWPKANSVDDIEESSPLTMVWSVWLEIKTSDTLSKILKARKQYVRQISLHNANTRILSD